MKSAPAIIFSRVYENVVGSERNFIVILFREFLNKSLFLKRFFNKYIFKICTDCITLQTPKIFFVELSSSYFFDDDVDDDDDDYYYYYRNGTLPCSTP